MLKVPPPYDPKAAIVVIDIGNSNTGLATWQAGELKTPISVATGDRTAFAEAFQAHIDACPREGPPAVVIGSVVPEALKLVRWLVSETLDREALVIGDGLPLPIDVGVLDARAIGVDRVCAAAAAYDRLRAACVIVDFGSAATVDLVDDDGVLLGGAILPGPSLQLRSLHEHTAQLPAVAPGVPETAYGRNTEEAMQTGVCRGLAGAVRAIIEGYASSINRWPQTVATGGDLEFMATHCDFLDSLVPHLTLQGIGLAYAKHLTNVGA
ncbi:MAG: type III pantothenate kinase [Planctomycetes bacterium]|nr:type III pantothenate kinase [Planctomycetota bacterium]